MNKTMISAAALAMVLSAVAASDPYDYKELTTTTALPVAATVTADGHELFDFGKDAIGWFEFVNMPPGDYEVVLGEMTNACGNVTNAYAGSTIRANRVSGKIDSRQYRVPFEKDPLNTRGWDPNAPSVMIPERLGIISAIRYAEIVKAPAKVTSANVARVAVHYPIDMKKSGFICDNKDLKRVYDLCKYSILATSFCGVYVDGDRERTPYEADAYINQLDQYAIDDDYSLGRKSHEWLMDHPTWPTEWKQHSIKIAWADWMWTGDKRSLEKYFDQLSTVKLMPEKCSKREDSLVVSTGETDSKGARDIIDWPRAERDGFDFGKVNAVVNAFHYRNLLEMRDIALALGKEVYAKHCQDEADRVKGAFLRTFIDPKDTLVRDCEGSEHKSLHANAIAVAMGLIDDANHRRRIAAYLDTRGMACSVYFAQYLLEAFFEADCADLAIKYMTAPGDRGWVGMMDFGSTITMEAWNMKAKPNQDLNHAWGAAPLNIISRYLLGVRPLEAGFKRILVAPQLGSLTRVSAVVPTAAGAVRLEVEGRQLKVSVPAPTLVVWKGETHQVGPGEHTFR